jgi:hypothetical protein
MTTIPHEPSRAVQPRSEWWRELLVPEMWATLAISVIWIATLFASIYSPDIASSSYLGDRVTIPAAVPLSLCAFLATWVVARRGYGRPAD